MNAIILAIAMTGQCQLPQPMRTPLATAAPRVVRYSPPRHVRAAVPSTVLGTTRAGVRSSPARVWVQPRIVRYTQPVRVYRPMGAYLPRRQLYSGSACST